MRKAIFTVLLILVSSIASAQVVVPSLDPALQNELSSSIAWRIGSTVGIDADYISVEKDASNDAESKSTRQAVLLAYQPGNYIGELYYAPYAETKAYSISQDSLSASWDNKSGSEYAIRLAIRGNRKVSVGIGVAGTQYDSSDDTFSGSYFEGSFSLRLFDGALFAGGGMQRVTEKLGSKDTRRFNRVISGVAIQLGDPTDVIFKTEAILKMSSAVDSEKNIMGKSPGITESGVSVELLTGSFLLSYQYRQLVHTDYLNSKDLTEKQNRYGVGLKMGSLTLSLYRQAWTVLYDDLAKDYAIYQATVGFSFL